MLYTMQLFREKTSPERKEMTRMLAAAIDMLWNRASTKGYKTHPEVVGFLERHKRLLECVEHIFIENAVKDTDKWRKISKLHISAGHAAALCYLMGSSGLETDGNVYRNEEPPSEKHINWSYWDRACDFWINIANSRDFLPVRMALWRLMDSTVYSEENQGLGGRGPEKLAIISKAWEVFKDHPEHAGVPFSDDDLRPNGVLCLSYTNLSAPKITNNSTMGGQVLPNNQLRLLDVADFGGIDCPDELEGLSMPPVPTREEIERATAVARARHGEDGQEEEIGSLDALAERARRANEEQKRKK